jgi:hypothetical protein
LLLHMADRSRPNAHPRPAPPIALTAGSVGPRCHGRGFGSAFLIISSSSRGCSPCARDWRARLIEHGGPPMMRATMATGMRAIVANEDAGVATPPLASCRVDRTERRFHSECLEFIRNEDSVGTRNEGWLIGFICSTCYSVDSVGRSIDPGPTDAHHQRPPPPITLTAGSVNSPIVADVPFSMWISILDHNFGQYP